MIELRIPDKYEWERRNKKTGRFLKGHRTHNKGKPWSEWMPEEVQERLRKNLTYRGGDHIGKWNAKRVVGIINGKKRVFKSSHQASRALNIHSSNIRQCARGERHTAGGYEFFWENDRK